MCQKFSNYYKINLYQEYPIAKSGIIPKNIQNWKNIFLANAVVAMEPAKAVKEYKDEIEKLKAKMMSMQK